ncbi:MAG: hypothetical protein RJB58_995 [Pseudomonadota bacterium]|jgi:hypothetical protein
MSQDDITLLTIALIVILGVVAAIAKFKMHPSAPQAFMPVPPHLDGTPAMQ